MKSSSRAYLKTYTLAWILSSSERKIYWISYFLQLATQVIKIFSVTIEKENSVEGIFMEAFGIATSKI